ncbi:CocE/NonD family hydrolase [Dietzia lutea]|uniref:Xaa-Pro dipeptidyl-peptidase C-terminal domain-containing protein n=1 Tax=Dietzia lutea TaxID=546160 RepID=A0A2S1R3W1_9ACTN|nr:CocE/NonD family hydrolase [Dietzia lutea]AWH90945.1 hypothetical protein A6035_00710 [Dietzia lutea]
MNIIVETDVTMTTRDGVILSSDVYRPEEGRHPVLLYRTPYDKSTTLVSAPVADPTWLARQGYVVVVQDSRGTGASEGMLELFLQEHDDGYDAVEWAAVQDWSTGNVGIFGPSAFGFATLGAVAARPPSLKAAMAFVAGPDISRSLFTGGAGSLFWISFLYGSVMPQIIPRLDLPEDERSKLMETWLEGISNLPETLAQLPLSGDELLADERIGGTIGAALLRTSGKDRLRELENQRCLAPNPEWVEAPLAMVTGWYDMFCQGMVELYRDIQSRPGHELMVGPWTHYGAYTSYTGGQGGARAYVKAPGGPPIFGPKIIEWFDRWLKADTAGQQPADSRVDFYVIGEDQWATSATWPPAGDTVKFALASSGSAGTLADDGRLTLAEPSGTADSYTYDPLNPVETRGGVNMVAEVGFSLHHSPDGIQDQRPVEARDDVLVYTSDVLEEPLRVVGPVRLTVWASSSADDTDFVARLVDVEPDGFSANVTEGVVRARYRDGRDDAWLTPGEPTEFEISLGDVAHCFGPGHRVRLDITSSSFPMYSRNLNTRTIPEQASADEAVIAEQSVLHDSDHPSRLELHVVSDIQPLGVGFVDPANQGYEELSS